MSETTLAERRDTRLAEAFRLEELAGLRLAARARLVALVVVAVWLFFWTSPPETVYLEMILVVFALIGIAHHRVRRGIGQGGIGIELLHALEDMRAGQRTFG